MSWQAATDILKARNWHLATAESCTGGMIAAEIVASPGVSEVFNGGVVAYHNQVKANVLHVDKSILEQFGAVSQECVEAMLNGVCRALDCECAVATSGVAGPDGGTPEKPVGLVFVGVKTPDTIVVERCMFNGNRQQIRQAAADYVNTLMMKILTKKYGAI